jgi:predicted PurR-regulated permease PerM
MYFAKSVIMLILFAALLAMLMKPVAQKLEKWGVKRVWSTALCLLIVVIVIGGIISMMTLEVNKIAEEWPKIKPKAESFFTSAQSWVQEKFNMTPKEQDKMLEENKSSFGEAGKKAATGLMSALAGSVAGLMLVLLFMVLFLAQREKYRGFVMKLYDGDNTRELGKVLDEVSKVAQKYLTGMCYSILILTTLYSIGFLIIGLKNAPLLAFIASVMVIIPYVGAWIGGIVPVSVALITGDGNLALATGAILVCVQLIDNNFIEPYVVGGEVRLSFAATLLALISGGTLWGIPGVILFVPLTGIMKIVFDHVEPLKPYGYLIGDQKGPPSQNIVGWFKKKFGKGKKTK